jgi:hypothetical protein
MALVNRDVDRTRLKRCGETVRASADPTMVPLQVQASGHTQATQRLAREALSVPSRTRPTMRYARAWLHVQRYALACRTFA